jgi:steroid delta-isomerase-like uncharacterized protein
MDMHNSADGNAADATDVTRSTVQRYHHELWERRNLATLDELVDDKFMDDSRASNTESDQPGPEYAKAFFGALWSAFPDLKSEQQQLIAEGELAAIRWILTGTMTGELWGMPATNKSFRVTGVDLIQVRDGKIVRDWGGMADQLPRILDQLGLKS